MAAQADFRDDVRVGGKSIYETSSDVTQQETRGEERWWELVLWSSVVSSLAAVLARFLLVPLVKVILIPVFAITLKIISVTIFGGTAMETILGNRGYVNYALKLFGEYTSYQTVVELLMGSLATPPPPSLH
ncbi:hypothetical protein Pcinc_032370 [Petrolisthes cinctipes]|uniref:Uncharacterized protein n=1 Tax=Petrolisthes cinctipes TaxID=88211 RepID=A0AAE1EUG6_PETCI|nr:hypothetical protein Pcinc_032370 [Petrolisthes cinctipes]